MFPIGINFLLNLAVDLALKIHQKSTQEAPKINKKSIKNNVQDMNPFFIDSLTLRVVAVDPCLSSQRYVILSFVTSCFEFGC